MDKLAVLGCGCGEVACWPLLVRTTLRKDTVIWSDFEQAPAGTGVTTGSDRSPSTAPYISTRCDGRATPGHVKGLPPAETGTPAYLGHRMRLMVPPSTSA